MNIPTELIKQTHEVLTRSVLPGIEYDLVKGIFSHIGTLIPVMNRISPPHNVAIPAIQGIVFNSDNEILQNMFYAILTKSMDKTKQNSTHPAFPRLLGELSLGEILFVFLSSRAPYLEFFYKIYYSQSDPQEHHIVVNCIDNSYFKDKDVFPIYQRCLSLLLTAFKDTGTPIFEYYGQDKTTPKVMSTQYKSFLSPFGKQFIEACLSPETEKLIQELIDNP